MWFEDFRVGQRFESAPRRVTREDVAAFGELSGDLAAIHTDAEYARSVGYDGPLVHGALGVGIVFGLLHELGIVDRTAIALRDLDWRFVAPIVAGDSLRLEMTITRCRRRPGRAAGLVNRHFRLRNGEGTVVQEGTSGFLVRAREDQQADRHGVATDFGSVDWALALQPLLEQRRDFADATRWFDGAVGLRSGREEVQLRIYRSRVLDCARSLPHGPSFTVGGSELDWVEAALAPRNEFIARSTAGAFQVSGDAYEYLRMTKALVAAWDAIRELAREEAPG